MKKGLDNAPTDRLYQLQLRLKRMKPALKRTIQIGNTLEVFLYQPEDVESIETTIAKKVNRGLNAGKTITENGYKSFLTVDALFDSSKITDEAPPAGAEYHGNGFTWAKDGERVKCKKILTKIDPNGNRTETIQGFVWKPYENIQRKENAIKG